VSGELLNITSAYLFQNTLVEELLKFLVAVVNTELLETIVLEILKSSYVKNACKNTRQLTGDAGECNQIYCEFTPISCAYMGG